MLNFESSCDDCELADGEKFGITLILPECAFSAELPRDTMAEMLKGIDDRLTEQGAPDEAEARCGIMVDNALAISSMIANRQMDHTVGIADIAYSFIYAFGKVIGLDQIDSLRGLTGSFIRNKLRLNPCLAEFDFQQATTFLSKKMADHDANEEEEWDYDIGLGPTIH